MSNENSENSSGGRKKTLLRIAVLFLVIGLAIFGYWRLIGQYSEYTDNAYVKGDLVAVEPLTSGVVIGVHVKETEHVSAGSPLVSLEKTDNAIALDKAKAALASVVRRVSAIVERVETIRSTISLRKIELSNSKREFLRRKELYKSKAVSEEVYLNAKTGFMASDSRLVAEEKRLSETFAAIGDGEVKTHPDVMSAKARLREAIIRLKRTTVVAPVSGVVAKSNAHTGTVARPGAPLMAIVADDGRYVEANFKESQLRHMRVDQPVRVTADLYGSDVEYSGKVYGVSSGTGAIFALLPPQNATGNWIKVVQRVPVRISLDERELKEKPLLLGLSMRVRVDTTNRGGSPLSIQKADHKVKNSDVYKYQDAGADEIIEKIVSENLPAKMK